MADNDTSALGISLEIPDEVFEKMEKADKYLDGLADKTEATANSIVEDFKRMGDDGVNYFIQRLSEAHSLLSSLGSTQFSVSGIDFSAGKKEFEELTAAQDELTAAQERYNEVREAEKALDKERSEIQDKTENLYRTRELAQAEVDLGDTITYRLKEYNSYDKALESLIKDYDKVAKAIKIYNDADVKTGSYPPGGSWEKLRYLEEQEAHYRNSIAFLRQYAEDENRILNIRERMEKANQKVFAADKERNELLEREHKLQFRDRSEEHNAERTVSAAKKKVAEAEAALGRAVAQNKPAQQQQVESLRQVSAQANLTKEDIEELSAAIVKMANQQAAANTQTVPAVSATSPITPETEKLIEDYKKASEEMERSLAALQIQQKEQTKQYASLEKRLNQYKAAKKKTTDEEKKSNDALKVFQRAMLATEGTLAQRTNKIAKLREAERRLVETGKDYSKELKIIKDETTRLNAAQEKAAKSAVIIQEKQKGLLRVGDQLRRALSLVFSVSQIRGYVTQLISIRGEFDKQNRALAAIMQNKDEADRLFGQITELAVRSPFQIKELVTYTKQLAAYRVENEKLYDTTKMLADVSAGLGVGMDRLILAYGQVKAANYLRGTELRQFSEAGINILGELAAYFSELEGVAVSTGEVFERVSKRMVTFKDVEVIFERLTEKGGIFYNMQEEQAKSVAGIVSNLKDSLEIMLNEIGKANDGVIKFSLNAIKGLIDNYKILTNLITAASTAFVVYAVKAAVATAANMALAKSGYSAADSMRQVEAASIPMGNTFAKLFKSLGSLGKFLKGNLWLVAVAGIVSVIKALRDHNKAVDEAREQYEILSRSIHKSMSTLDELVSGIEEQDRAISQNKEALKGLEKGTEKYIEVTNKLNDAERQKSVLVNKLKAQYPELAREYEKQGAQVSGLTGLQENYNNELRKTLALNYAMQSSEGFFNEGLFKDLEDLAEAESNLTSATEQMEVAYDRTVRQIERLIATNEAFNERYGDTLTSIINSQKSDYEKLSELRDTLIGDNKATPGMRAGLEVAWGTDKEVREYMKAMRQFKKDAQEAQREVDKVVNAMLDISGVDTAEAFKGLDEISKESAKGWAKTAIESIPNIKNKFIQDFVNQRFEMTLGIKFNFNKEGQVQELSWLASQIQNFINSNKDMKGVTLFDFKDDESTTDYFERLNKQIDGNIKEIDELGRATEQRNKDVTNDDAIKALEEENRLIDLLLSAYGIESALSKQREKDDDDAAKAKEEANKKAEQRLKDQISLLKDINAAYKKNKEEMSDDEAIASVQEAFAKRAKSLGLNDFIVDAKFDDDSLVSSLEKLMESSAPSLRDNLEEVISELKATMGIELKISNRETVQKELDEMFDLYSHIDELKDAGIDGDILKSFLGLDEISLDDITRKLLESQAAFKGNKGLALYQEYLDKITKMRRKQTEEDVLEMSKYLKLYLDEIETIETQGAKDILLGETLFKAGAISAEEFGQVVEGVTKDVREKVAKINLEKFKESSIYIKAMGELAAYSREELQGMASTLKDTLAQNAKDMGVDEIREYQEAIERITSQLDKMKSPAEQNNIAELLRLIELQKELNKQKEKEASLSQRKAALDAERAALETILKRQADTGDVVGAALTRNQLKDTITAIQEVDGQMVAIASEISVISAEVADLGEGMVENIAKAQKIVDEIAYVTNATTKIFGDIKEVADSLGVETDSGAWAKTSVAMETMSGVTGELTQGLANFASGNYAGAIANVVGAVAKLVVGFNRAHDQTYTDIIVEQTERVQDLEKAYGVLNKKVDEIMSIRDYRQTFENMQDNIKARIEAEKAIIAAEEAKKASDEEALKDANDRLQQLLEEQKDTTEKMLEGLGGFGSEANMSSAAQEFADAWLSAYKETGDGLDALTEKWDDYIDNVIAKQLMLKGSKMFLEPIMQILDEYLADSEYTTQEAAHVQKAIDELMPKLNEYWKAITAGFDIKQNAGSETEMSGLQKGIQAVTEDTAQALEALLNSVRFYAADTNAKVAALTSFDPELNPLLAELKLQTSHILSIERLVKSIVRTGHRLGESGIRVFLD